MPEIEKLHKKIALKSFKIRKDIEKKLSRFFNRAHPFPLILQQARDRVELWTRTVCNKSNVATSLTKIKRLSIKLKEYSGHFISKSKAVKMLKKAKRVRSKVENEASKIQNVFIEELMKKRAKDCKVSVETLRGSYQEKRKQEK